MQRQIDENEKKICFVPSKKSNLLIKVLRDFLPPVTLFQHRCLPVHSECELAVASGFSPRSHLSVQTTVSIGDQMFETGGEMNRNIFPINKKNKKFEDDIASRQFELVQRRLAASSVNLLERERQRFGTK